MSGRAQARDPAPQQEEIAERAGPRKEDVHSGS